MSDNTASHHCCVIGGTGFIGRSLVQQLQQAGRQTSVISRTKPLHSIPGVTYMIGNYGDRSFLEASLKGVDEIVLLAYASVPKTSFEDPFADLVENVPSALGLFEIAVKLHLKKVIVVSSGGTVYGQASHIPITENHPTNPISPYGITKLAIEKYAGLFRALDELPVIIVRPANAYGEEQQPFRGQGFIATAIASIVQQKEITLFGEQGSLRDFIHVEDIASAILSTLQHGVLGECYNVGTGVGTTTKQIIDQLTVFAQLHGMVPQIRVLPARKFDVLENTLDSSKLHKATGWQANIPLEIGLQRTWQYQLAQYE